METLIYVFISFLFGCLCCYLLLKWHQEREYKIESERLRSEKIHADFDLWGGITYYRPSRLGLGQNGKKEKLSGANKLYIVKHENYLEIFSAWSKVSPIQIDPFPLYLSTENCNPDTLIEFGNYFLELGNVLNKKYERT